jgi:NADPH:quinone reductase
MKAIVFDRFGPPEEVLHVGERPTPEPGRGEVRVRMRFSPVNPSDLLHVRGEYGKRPELPASAGFEGFGVVDKTGPGLLQYLRGLKPGRRVAVINGNGANWGEYAVIPVRQAIPIPDGIPDEQAATFFVNPASALVMTRLVLRLQRGDWLLQTAAGSTLGRMVIRLGKLDGFRTISVVRRREQVEELKKLGADAVICTADEPLVDRVMALTDGKGVIGAIDAVGGATASDVVKTLAFGGRLLCYGTLSGEPLVIDPRTLMVNHRRVEGFWLSQWVRGQGVLTMLKLFRSIGRLMKEGVLTSDVGPVFGMDQVREAARVAGQPGRQGKVLLRID